MQTRRTPSPVKLLFDQNLSHRLVHALRQEYPDSEHVRDVGLGEATDEAVWHYAAQEGFTLITKDATFINGVSSSAIHPRSSGCVATIAPPQPLSSACACITPPHALFHRPRRRLSRDRVSASLSVGGNTFSSVWASGTRATARCTPPDLGNRLSCPSIFSENQEPPTQHAPSPRPRATCTLKN